jgi:hypothetical protein
MWIDRIGAIAAIKTSKSFARYVSLPVNSVHCERSTPLRGDKSVKNYHRLCERSEAIS